MNMFKLFIVLLPFLAFNLQAQTPYQDDEVNFYVQDNPTNESLEQVNFLLCIMDAMQADQFVGYGNYSVDIHEKKCEQDASDEQQASEQKAATATSANDKKNATETSASGGASNGAEYIATPMIMNSERADTSSAQVGKFWALLVEEVETEEDGQSSVDRPEMMVKGNVTVTQSPSATLPYGELDMSFNYLITKAFDNNGQTIPANTNAGGARLITNADGIEYYDLMMGGLPAKVKTVFQDANKTKVAGIFYWGRYVEVSSNNWVPMALVQQFSLDESIKAYCLKFVKAYTVDWSSMNAQGEPALSEYTPSGSDGIDTGENCYSTDKADASRTVHRYGVYNSDGSRLALTGTGAFPMEATITVNSEQRKARAWANFYNIHIDDQDRANVNANTVWTKRLRSGETGPAPTYKIETSNTRLEKVTVETLSLADLHKLNFETWIEGDNSSYWGSQIQSLGFPAENAEYKGTYDKDTNGGTWTFTHKITHNSGYTETDITDIVFTNANWVNTVKKVYGSGQSWEHTYVRDMWMWSPDTRQSYNIEKNSFENPTSNSATNGIRTRKYENVTPANFPAELKCVERCPTQALIEATYTNAVSSASSNATATVASPYDANNWQYLTSAGGGYQAGDHFEGILGTNVKTYTKTGINYTDGTTSNGGTLGIPASITSPETQLKRTKFFMPWNGGNSDSELTRYRLHSGKLVVPTDLAKLDCPRQDENDSNSAYRSTHPVFNANDARYCTAAFYDRSLPASKQVTSWYQMAWGPYHWDKQNFLVDQATSQYVSFAEPKTLYYTVWDEAKYGTDRGKKIALKFEGFGELHGIPGHVIDTRDGSVVGQYVNQWQNHHRYVNRFIIEASGSNAEPTLTDKDGTTYKVKALEGDEWLALKNSVRSTLTYSGAINESDLPDISSLKNHLTGADAIGDLPSGAQLYGNGDPVVIHGECVYAGPPCQ